MPLHVLSSMVVATNVIVGGGISAGGNISAVGQIKSADTIGYVPPNGNVFTSYMDSNGVTTSGAVTASGKINTGYTTLNDFACRRIQISQGGSYHGVPQAGDILLII